MSSGNGSVDSTKISRLTVYGRKKNSDVLLRMLFCIPTPRRVKYLFSRTTLLKINIMAVNRHIDHNLPKDCLTASFKQYQTVQHFLVRLVPTPRIWLSSQKHTERSPYELHSGLIHSNHQMMQVQIYKVASKFPRVPVCRDPGRNHGQTTRHI